MVHGRNSAARDALFTLLRAASLEPLEWEEMVKATDNASPFVGEILDAGFKIARAVVVMFTGDEDAQLHPEWVPNDSGVQSRPNVFFEAGMALVKQPTRTVLVQIGAHRPVSDLAGRHVVRFDDNKGTARHALLKRLKDAGCEVNLDGSDWMNAGDFTRALVGPKPVRYDELANLRGRLQHIQFRHRSLDQWLSLMVSSKEESPGIRMRLSKGWRRQASWDRNSKTVFGT